MSRSSKVFAGVVVAAALGVAAYWHFSPYHAMSQMKAAARAQDGETFNSYVDYPKLRENLKAQMTNVALSQIGGSSESNAAMQGVIVSAFIGPLVDTLVQPEVVMKAIGKGEFDPEGEGAEDGDSSENEPIWTVERDGFHKVLAHASDPREPGVTQFTVVFERSGFATWRLTEFQMNIDPLSEEE